MSKASTSKDPEQKAIAEKNEQYINDLEKALKDFKVSFNRLTINSYQPLVVNYSSDIEQ